MKRAEKKIMNEAWWIDFMEGEVSEDDREMMEMLLEHSLTDQLILENYRAVRRQIKNADPVKEYEKLLHDPIYLMKLNGQIMENLKAQPVEKPSRLKRFMMKRLRKFNYIMA